MSSTSTNARPLARSADLVTSEASHELLAYDSRHHHLHHLDPIAAAVWRRCDGEQDVDALALAVARDLGTEITADVVRVALTKLDEASLLEGQLPDDLRVSTRNRRSLLRRAAGAVVLPAVVSVTAPLAADAQSQCQHFVGPGAECNGTTICCISGYICQYDFINCQCDRCVRP